MQSYQIETHFIRDNDENMNMDTGLQITWIYLNGTGIVTKLKPQDL